MTARVPASSGSLTATGDVTITSKTGGVSGDIIFKQGSAERARVSARGLAVEPTLAMVGTIVGGVSTAEPLINWYSDTGDAYPSWQTGLDVANSVNGDLVLAAKSDPVTGVVEDFIYVRNNVIGLGVGIGYTPPPNGYTLAVNGADNTAQVPLLLRLGQSNTGAVLTAQDSAGNVRFRINNDGSLRGTDNVLNALGLAITGVGTDASNVLTVTGPTTQTGDVLHVGLSGQTSKFAIQNDGGASVKLSLTGGNSQVTFRNQTQIATLVANSAADLILVMKMAATPSGAPLLIQKSDSSTLFTVTAAGNVGIVDGGNITVGATTGTKIATSGGAAGSKLGFFGATPVVQPLLATGAAHTVDDVIATLQTLGLVRQS